MNFVKIKKTAPATKFSTFSSVNLTNMKLHGIVSQNITRKKLSQLRSRTGRKNTYLIDL